MFEAARLLPLAESIADGSPVDWTAAQAYANPEEQEILRQLRIVADLALLHRSLPADPRDLPPERRRNASCPAVACAAPALARPLA